MKKVILVGYMGAGKSTIGKFLSKEMDSLFLDLDNLIEKKTNLSIPELFQQKGEIYFRKIEHTVFKEVLEREDSFILSTCGGTPCYADNHLLLQNENVVSIYLKTSIETIISRVEKKPNKRPLLVNKSKEELIDFVSKQLFERSYYYHHANHTIQTDNKSVIEIVDEIKMLLY